jgi:hypothetical protein
MRHMIFFAAMLTLFGAASAAQAQTPVADSAPIWHTYVSHVPIGTTLTLRLNTGESLKAVLLSADESGMKVKPATRIPEPSRRIEYAAVTSIERRQDGVSFGKHAAVGAGIGAATFLLLFLGAQ